VKLIAAKLGYKLAEKVITLLINYIDFSQRLSGQKLRRNVKAGLAEIMWAT